MSRRCLTSFLLPDLGEGLTEAEIVRWLVAVGDVVAVDQPVVEVETAKAWSRCPARTPAGRRAARRGRGRRWPSAQPLITVATAGDAPDGRRRRAPAGAGAIARTARRSRPAPATC